MNYKWPFITAVAWLPLAFHAGMDLQEHWYGRVSLDHFSKIAGDPLNRGQIELDIKFPPSIKLGQIRLPDGGIYPEPGKPRWVEVIGDHGETKDWLDRLDFETYEWGAKDVAPTFKEACAQINPTPESCR